MIIWKKIIVSFLNTVGGELKIGITDEGNIISGDNPDEIMNKISARVSNNIIPNPIAFVIINGENIQNKVLISVKVSKGIKPIYYIKKYGLSESGVYIRIGSVSYSMQQDEINRRYLESLNYKAPLITEIAASNQKLTFKDLKIIYSEKWQKFR